MTQPSGEKIVMASSEPHHLKPYGRLAHYSGQIDKESLTIFDETFVGIGTNVCQQECIPHRYKTND